MTVIRVVVADDQTAVREGLVVLLDLADDIAVVGSASDGEEALRLVADHHPDVVSMDLRRAQAVQYAYRNGLGEPG